MVGAVVLGTVGDHGDLGRVDVPAGDEPVAGGLRHRDERGRAVDERGEHAVLVGRRAGEHGVQDRDHRDAEALDDVEDVLAVRPAEDAVLVLHDRDVEVVEHECRVDLGATLAADPLVHDGEHLHLGRVHKADDADVGAGAVQVTDERLGERRDAALRRGIGGQETEPEAHGRLLSRCLSVQPMCCRSRREDRHPRGARPSGRAAGHGIIAAALPLHSSTDPGARFPL